MPPNTIGDGGLWTTADDLLIWNDAMNRKYFGNAIHDRAEGVGVLADGTPIDYAWGIRVIELAGQTCFSHGGGWPGMWSNVLRQPHFGTSVALVTDCEDPVLITRIATEILQHLATSADSK